MFNALRSGSKLALAAIIWCGGPAMAGPADNALTPAQCAAVAEQDRQLNAAIAAHDAAKAAALYADQFQLTAGTGKRKTKTDMLADIARTDLALEVNETTEVDVRCLGTTAVLTAVLRQKGTLGGKAFDMRLLVTDTWVQQGKSWQLLAGHASPAGPA